MNKRRIVAGTIAGSLLGAVLAYAWWPSTYTSKAVLRIVPPIIQEGLFPVPARANLESLLPSLAQAITARGSLAGVVLSYGLYEAERSRMPMEDVIERMRNAIRIVAVSPSSVEVSFTYPDRIVAQKVASGLVGRLTAEYTRERTTAAGMTTAFLNQSVETAAAAWEESLAKVRAARSSGQSVDRAALDAELAARHYRLLREKAGTASMVETMERRMQVERLDVFDPPSLPKEPGMIWVLLVVGGALVGAAVGWAAGARGRG